MTLVSFTLTCFNDNILAHLVSSSVYVVFLFSDKNRVSYAVKRILKTNRKTNIVGYPRSIHSTTLH